MQPLDADSHGLKRFAKLAIVTAVVLILALFTGFVALHAAKEGSWIVDAAKTHFAAVIGLPFVALMAAFIVATFEISFGRIEFEGLGFRFRGASGPIVLWVLCYLAIALTVKILW